MKVAHLVMAYKNPQQVERLVRAMSHKDFYIFIHLDKKIDIAPYEHLGNFDRVFFILNRVECNWGGFSFVQAILTSLEEIVCGSENFQFINLMSGQDYPIKSVDKIYNFLVENSEKCFISYDTDPKRKWWDYAMKRLELYHLTDMKFIGKYFFQGVLNKYLPKRKFPANMDLYGSSDASWWTLTTPCARYIVEYIRKNKELKRFLQFTWGADEFLIGTIIMNSPFKASVVNNNLRLITWTEGVANPRILTMNDLPLLQQSDSFFARKFDSTVDSNILNELDMVQNKCQ